MRAQAPWRSTRLWAAFVVTAAAACGAQPGSPTPVPSSSQPLGVLYIEEMLKVMEENSVNRLRIDWASFRSQVRAATGQAATIPETFTAIRLALGLLDDHHSFYSRPNGAGGFSNPFFPSGCSASAPTPSVPADVGYVRIGAFSGSSSAGGDFAAAIQDEIRRQDSDSLAGWIVDLRGNGGGNMFPMLAGVGPILGTGTSGYFVPPVGLRTAWGYLTSGSFSGNFTATPVAAYELKRANPRVAVLMDKAVASSGEALVVAFQGRANSRAFGTETCGVPTANSGFTLSDGALLVMTTALDADRTGRVYDSAIQPDEADANPASVVQRAINWLRGS